MYGKFYASTFTGSMYGAGADVFAVWGYVIANAFQSQVELNPQLLSGVLGMTPDRAEAAISYLCSPDPNSRSKTHDGRRLVREGQFAYFIPNHAVYLSIRNGAERREYNREKQAEYRARKRQLEHVKACQSAMSNLSAHIDIDTDIDINKEEREGETPSSPRLLSDLWNVKCKKLPQVLSLSKQRTRKASLRLRERSLEEWGVVFDRISSSAFCCGENDRGWRATFDWIVHNTDNALKVLEGKYDDRKKRDERGPGGLVI